MPLCQEYSIDCSLFPSLRPKPLASCLQQRLCTPYINPLLPEGILLGPCRFTTALISPTRYNQEEQLPPSTSRIPLVSKKSVLQVRVEAYLGSLKVASLPVIGSPVTNCHNTRPNPYTSTFESPAVTTYMHMGVQPAASHSKAGADKTSETGGFQGVQK